MFTLAPVHQTFVRSMPGFNIYTCMALLLAPCFFSQIAHLLTASGCHSPSSPFCPQLESLAVLLAVVSALERPLWRPLKVYLITLSNPRGGGPAIHTNSTLELISVLL